MVSGRGTERATGAVGGVGGAFAVDGGVGDVKPVAIPWFTIGGDDDDVSDMYQLCSGWTTMR